jgi:hypothetical protein
MPTGSCFPLFLKGKTMLYDAKYLRPGAFEHWIAEARIRAIRDFTGKERAAMFELYSSCYTIDEALQELPHYLD